MRYPIRLKPASAAAPAYLFSPLPMRLPASVAAASLRRALLHLRCLVASNAPARSRLRMRNDK